jgi:hypothetical protein
VIEHSECLDCHDLMVRQATPMIDACPIHRAAG